MVYAGRGNSPNTRCRGLSPSPGGGHEKGPVWSDAPGGAKHLLVQHQTAAVLRALPATHTSIFDPCPQSCRNTSSVDSSARHPAIVFGSNFHFIGCS